MAYIRTKLVRIKIKDLAKLCGFFTSKTDWNDGYGCLAKERLFRDGPGMCCDFICPLAYTADLEDMKEKDFPLYEEWIKQCKKDGVEPVTLEEGSWVIQYRKKYNRNGGKNEW